MNLHGQLVPGAAIVTVTLVFFAGERIHGGRTLPPSPGWHARALAMNVAQLGLIGLGGLTWNRAFRDHALLHPGLGLPPVAQGALYWFIGTFVFYWWHRLRHADGFWVVLHQLHHSPSRIELLTSFYKHPIEIAADSIITSALVYGLCGGSAEAGAWTSFFGATGEYFYHANIRTPHWIGWFLQRPEHHSIHHALGVHRYNYGDITSCSPMSVEPKVYPDPVVDREAVIVRGVCGAALGVVFAIGIWIRCQGFGLWGSAALFAGSIVVCTVEAIRHADSFWYGLLRRRH